MIGNQKWKNESPRVNKVFCGSNMYSVIPVKASPNNWPGKSTCQSNCGNKIPTAGIDTSNARSHQTATSVMSSATSQKYKKFVSPYASVTTGTPIHSASKVVVPPATGNGSSAWLFPGQPAGDRVRGDESGQHLLRRAGRMEFWQAA